MTKSIPDFDLIPDPFSSRILSIMWKEAVPASLTRSVMLNVVSRYVTDKTDVVKCGVIQYLQLLVEEQKLFYYEDFLGELLPLTHAGFWRYDFSHELKPGDQVLTFDRSLMFTLDEAETHFNADRRWRVSSGAIQQHVKLIQRGNALGVFLGQGICDNKNYAVVFVLGRPMVYSVWDLSCP